MKQRIKFLAWWFFPVILHSVYQLLMHGKRAYVMYDAAENTAFALIILLILSILKGKWRSFVTRASYVMFILTLLFEGLYYDIFATYFSSSALFIFLETNTAEAFEFSESYLQPRMWTNVIIAVLMIFAFFKRSDAAQLKTIFKLPILIKVIAVILLGYLIKTSGYIIANVPYAILKSSFEYYQEKQKMQAYQVDRPEGNFENVTAENSEDQQIYVMVIGESTSRRHLGIYGYPRETTPNFKKKQDELLVYSDIVSTSATTIQSLKKALTLNNFKDPKQESTLIQLMNQAGFETHWISNQKPVGIYDSFVTQVAKASDHFTFTNSTIYSSVTPLDEVLLPHYKKALASDSEKVFIVVHLLGTHSKYRYRYPEDFAHFEGKTPSKFQHQTATETVNHFDNAIRYVDHLIGEMIDQLKDQQASSYLLYFSDHGDEVYDIRDFKGHNDDNPTPAMFEIPFVLWRSPSHQQQFPIAKDTARAGTIDHLIHSLSDLSDIRFERYQAGKSIFSKDYQAPEKRILGSQKDEYEALKEKNDIRD